MMQTLSSVPDAQKLYLKAASTVLRKSRGEPKLPDLSVSVSGVTAEADHLAQYAEVCGFGDTRVLPITFPHVMAGALHLYLMTQKPFPFPLLGLVHIGNVIRQTRALAAGERFDLSVRLGESRRVRQGIEFDLLTEVTVEGEVIWTETSTILHRIPGSRQPSSRPQPAPASLTEYKPFNAPVDIGRRYAGVGRDYNPIHLSPWSAKLFGFKRHIAHGMWSLAHCAALLESELGRPASVLEVQFRQPLFLPGKAALKFQPDTNGVEFALLATRSAKTHLVGRIA